MQPSAAMNDLIEQGYHLFRRYRVPARFNVCCHYCFSAEQQRALRETSIRAVPFELMMAWNSSSNPEQQDSDEIRYLLPRLLELIAQREFPGIYAGICLRRVGETDIRRWRADERLFLLHFGQQFMRDWLLPGDAVDLYLILEMFWFGGLNIAPLLDTVLEEADYWATVSLAWLLCTYRSTLTEGDSESESIAQQISVWVKHAQPLLTERAGQAIEVPMKQSQYYAGSSLDIDSWMIDECLCAMHEGLWQS